MTETARRAAEHAARDSYGRLLALLASRSGDIASAEDALSDAFAAALRVWPLRGVPDNPDAWLLTAARRSAGHARARAATASAAVGDLMLLGDAQAAAAPSPCGDDRLRLMLVCTHPAIDAAIQAPLMLQVVLGLDCARIAASFMVSPAAMGQRLVRAKTKIRDAGIRFPLLQPGQLGWSETDAREPALRMQAILRAIYAAYGTGWEDVAGTDPRRAGLPEEAIWLGRLVVTLLPRVPEAMGLLALMLYCEARHGARRDPAGNFVPLAQQNPRLWHSGMIGEAETLLRHASSLDAPGRFQTEAAIQSVHVQACITGRPNHAALLQLYDSLFAIAPSIGACVARACAYAEAGQPGHALALLGAVETQTKAYQPWWAARARASHLLGCAEDARHAAERAAGLSHDPAIRRHLLSGGLFAG